MYLGNDDTEDDDGVVGGSSGNDSANLAESRRRNG